MFTFYIALHFLLCFTIQILCLHGEKGAQPTSVLKLSSLARLVIIMMPKMKICGYALVVSACHFISIAAAQSTAPSEVNALSQIKNSLIDPMNHLWNWNKGDPCGLDWTGVSCFSTVGADGYFHVQELNVMTMNLSGSLAPQLGQLSKLEKMNFMWNKLTGNIPREIGNITSLKLLLLNGNALSGTLPHELGNLQNLNRLQLDENQLFGPIPKSFANLVSVKHIHMNNNSLTGQIPPNLSKLPNLMHLLLENNNLSGYLPSEFSMLPNLRIIQLDNNSFRGTGVPASYANLSRLAKLSLRNCRLLGEVPDLSSIPRLYYLDLSWNSLTGSIPSNKLADHMTTIDLSNNNLKGPIPESFSALLFLQRLSLENNNLSGPISASIWKNMSSNTSAKRTVDLSNNSLSQISGDLTTPANVNLRLGGNPICKNSSTSKILVKHCGLEGQEADKYSRNSTPGCPVQACPVDDFYEYVPDSPVPCFCASLLVILYRLKSPSFSFFPPYSSSFKSYVTQSLDLDFYQLSIVSYAWEGHRLGMHLKLYPKASYSHSNLFNASEVYRIRTKFTSWDFPSNDTFGPYELLDFPLEGHYANLNMESEKGKISLAEIAIAIVSSLALVLAISALVTVFIFRRNIRYRHKLSRKCPYSNISIKIDGVKEFTFNELAFATDDFSGSNQVGQGGYGVVYKGILHDETIVAIKRAQEGSLQGQKEFLNEIELLSRLHHRNLVSLVGYCHEEGEQMLVYEFMPNGTLRDWLSGTKGNLTFGMRLRIAIGSAKGISYLHNEANPPIFHRDIKATNILLDSKIIAKVADFGLSRLAPHLDDGTGPKYVSTVVKGTPGYLDPEYLLTHKLTDKSDVYSLGVVFLELLTAMPPISRGKNIVREVNMAYESGMKLSIIDKRMGSYPPDCVERFTTLALRCCHDDTDKRPSMLDVVRELENIAAMLPITESSLPEIASHYDSQVESSGSYFMSEKQQVSSSASEFSLISGDVSATIPR